MNTTRLRLQNETHFVEFEVPQDWVALEMDRLRTMRKQGFYAVFRRRHVRVVNYVLPHLMPAPNLITPLVDNGLPF